MLKSMTGFGKAICELSDKAVTIEIRSLNSKQNDINTKIHPLFRDKDIVIRNLIQSRLLRGKIDVYINYEVSENAKASHLNTGVITDYTKQIKGLAENLGVTLNEEVFSSILRMPDVLTMHKDSLNDKEWQNIEASVNEALDALISFRTQEGDALEKDLLARIDKIDELLTRIVPFEEQRIETTKQRIKNALNDLNNEDVDHSRFEQELIYYLEKLDITEEKVRLRNHLKYFKETAETPGSIGKKMGFISQEIGREINTIGSKANQSDIQKIVVLMKDELEKIKEQSLNVL